MKIIQTSAAALYGKTTNKNIANDGFDSYCVNHDRNRYTSIGIN